MTVVATNHCLFGLAWLLAPTFTILEEGLLCPQMFRTPFVPTNMTKSLPRTVLESRLVIHIQSGASGCENIL